MRKKVLVISNNPFFGGGETFIINSLSHTDADLFYLVRNKELQKGLKVDGVFKFHSSSLYHQLHETKSIINQIKPDTIVLNGGSTMYFAPFLTCKNVIIYRHTTNAAVTSFLKRIVYILFMHFCYGCADKVVHVSEYAKKEQKFFTQKAHFIYHGVDTAPKKDKKICKPYHVLFVGRVEKSKGIDLILEVFSEISPEVASLQVVGEGGELDYFKKKYTQSNIHFAGFRQEVDCFYRESDLFITLPDHEAFGLSILDAMKHGLPVIGTKAGAIPELIIDSYNGLLVNKNKKEIQQAFSFFFSNDENIKKMGENGYDRCNLIFTKEKMGRQITALF